MVQNLDNMEDELLDDRVHQIVHEATGLELTLIQQVLAAVESTNEYEIVRITLRPRRLRCRQCKQMKDSATIEEAVCAGCRTAPLPDDRSRSTSVTAVSGGLPSLGRRRR